MRPARDHAYLLAGLLQFCRKQAADRSGADNADFHSVVFSSDARPS